MKETATRPNAGPIAGSHSGPSNVLMGMTQQLAEQAHRLESVAEQIRSLDHAFGKRIDESEQSSETRFANVATGLEKIAARLDRLEAAADESATVARDSRTMQDALVAVAALEEVRAQLQEADQEIELLRRSRVEDIARIRSLAADRDALESEMQANAARHRRELVKLNAAPALPAPPPAPPPPPVVQAVTPQSTISPVKVASDVAFTRRVYKAEMPPFTRNGPLDQNKAAALLEHARSVMRSRDWAAAATAYADYLSYQPLRARQWKQYGHALKEMGDLNGAERAYYRALTLEPSDCDTAIHLAHVLKDQGLLDAAGEVFAAVLQMAPGSLSAREGLAILGYPEPEGLAPPRPASRRPSLLQRYLFKKDLAAAKQAARGRDWVKAAEIYGHLSARRPSEAGLVIRRGHALKELGKLEDAAAMYRKALLLEPLSSDAHLQLGHALKLLGDRDGARRSYISAVRFGPDNQDALDEL